MKKKTLIVAVATTLGSPLVFAQTSVQLYGVADAGVSVIDRGDSTLSGTPAASVPLGSAFQVHSGVQSTSRFGIRGSEDLGNGLKAIFAAEGAWNVDDGTGGATGGSLNFARRSVVGLGGSFGTLLLGRDYLPAFFAGQALDVSSFGMYGTSYAYAQTGGFTIRASNAIHYTSPSWGGLVLRASYGSAERYEAPKSLGNVWGTSLLYTSGAITASAYFQAVRVASVPAGSTDTQKQFGAGAGYNFGVARVLAGWGRSENPGDSTNFDSWNIGVGVRVGAGELIAGVTRLKADPGRNASIGTAPNNGSAGVEGKAKIFALGYSYPLSKRTNVYGTFGLTDNDAGAAFGLFSNGTSIAAGTAGENVRALGFGVRHTF